MKNCTYNITDSCVNYASATAQVIQHKMWDGGSILEVPLQHLSGEGGREREREEKQKSEISGSHSSEYEDGCLLGCCAMQPGRSLPTFQRCLLPPSSGQYDGGGKHL
jgi:hypothetical protein